jgi:putative membrane protein
MKSLRSINTKKISSAIADFENQVDFEFVPVIATKSSYVEHIQWILSLIFLLFFVGSMDLFFHDTWDNKTLFFIFSPLVAIALGTLLDKSDLVDRFFISKREQVRQVQEKAERIFYLKKLHQVESKNALLLYISIMEKQIILLPDPDLSGAQKELLNQLSIKALKILQQNFKAKEYEIGLTDTIQMLKSELADTFPKGPSTKNHVPNKLIFWDEFEV